MVPPEGRRLTGIERLIAPGLDVEQATVLDFWQWAFSDLRLNSLRGVFAEWLVARLLNLPPPTLDFWAGWDYVFCVQTETDPARWDALDLGQWRFYLLDQAALATRGLKSIRLPVLATLCPALTAAELRERVLARVPTSGR